MVLWNKLSTGKYIFLNAREVDLQLTQTTSAQDIDQTLSFTAKAGSDYIDVLIDDASIDPTAIRVYDVNGHEFKGQTSKADNHSYRINGLNLVPGVYFVKLEVGHKTATRQSILYPLMIQRLTLTGFLYLATGTLLFSPSREETLFLKVADFALHFDYNSSQLSDSAVMRIDHMLDSLSKYKDKIFILSAHTSQSGSVAYNQRLSEKGWSRYGLPWWVKGIDSTNIEGLAFGKERPIVKVRAKRTRLWIEGWKLRLGEDFY